MNREDTANRLSGMDHPRLIRQSSFTRSFYESNLSSETVKEPLQEAFDGTSITTNTTTMSTTCTSTRALSSSGQFDVDEVYASLLPCHEPACTTSSDANNNNNNQSSSAPASRSDITYDLIDNVAHKMDADFAESDAHLMHLDPSLMTALRLSDAYVVTTDTTTTTTLSSYNNTSTDRDIPTPTSTSVAPNTPNKVAPISNFYMDLLENEKEKEKETDCSTFAAMATAYIAQAENNTEQWVDDHQAQDDLNRENRIQSPCSSSSKWGGSSSAATTQQADLKGDDGQSARLLNRSQSLTSTTSPSYCAMPVIAVECVECGVSLQVDPNVTLVFCPSCRTISPTKQSSSHQRRITENTTHSI